jgi:hypothetical protein
MSTALRTKDHEAIREWVEERGGHPAQVKGTGGLLRIDFGGPEESLEPIGWDQFFEVFDQSDIAFLHSDQKKSRSNKFVASNGNGEDEDEEEDEDEDDDDEDEDEDEDGEDDLEDDEDLEDEDDEDEDEDEDELEEDEEDES